MRLSGPVFLFLVAAAQAGATASHRTTEIVGRWNGTSVCTKADWNAACHDEDALYEFQEGVAPGHVLAKGYKIVNGKAEYMGDLDFAYDGTANAWVAEHIGPRVQSRWIFEVQGDVLNGRAVFPPSMRVGRTIHLTRQTSR